MVEYHTVNMDVSRFESWSRRIKIGHITCFGGRMETDREWFDRFKNNPRNANILLFAEIICIIMGFVVYYLFIK